MKKFLAAMATAISLFFVSACGLRAAEMVSFKSGAGFFELVREGLAADIYFDGGDHPVVAISAEDLADDIERVTGVRPSLKNSRNGLSAHAVLIGTIGKSGIIEELAARGMIDLSAIRGSWETYFLTVVEKPIPGVKRALVIAGSDPRGAAYGAYELSRAIGVSPWVWWADSAPARHDQLFVRPGYYRFGPPSVKYRGIFLNDEDFGLQPWAAKTFDPELGDIGPRTYERIFELLLRLRANHLWPAMHNVTRAFNYYPESRRIADNYAIVMGSAHCEQMLRNNVDEWNRDGKGPWWYQFNRENILGYWEQRVRENGKYENIYTLGMRALHDTPIHALGSTRTIIDLLEQIIADQRGLLAKWVNPDVTKVPQVFCPYNEVLGYLKKGLKLPSDVTILWVDDNHGYIRRLSSPEEQKRPGGSGVYYHVSYWGLPYDYLWLCSTPPALIWEEMKKAYDHGADRIWMLNVGDIKPAEIDTEFFLTLAWDADRFGPNAQREFLRSFAAREFGAEFGPEISEILDLYFLLNQQRKPEHMGFNNLALKSVPTRDPRFSLVNFGDEAQQRMDAYASLEARATAVYKSLAPEKRDSYYQLVLYPVRCSLYMNQKFLYAYKSREYAKQGRSSAGQYAKMAAAAFANIDRETHYYNEQLAHGKWNGMISWHPRNLAAFEMPRIGKPAPVSGAGFGLALEGGERPVLRAGQLPAFNRFTRRKHFIDLFNRGDKPVEWTAAAPDWVRLSASRGVLELEQRLWVEVDYDQAPKRDNVAGTISFAGAGAEFKIKVAAQNPASLEIPAGAFVQENGFVAIDASSFARNSPGAGGAQWTIIPGLGRTGAAIAILPSNTPPAAADSAPLAEYSIYIFNPGKARLTVHALPAFPVVDGRRSVVAVSIDDGKPVEVELDRGGIEFFGVHWAEAELSSVMYGGADLAVEKGRHVLRVYGIDPSAVIDRIVLDFGGLKPSYLGPPESAALRD